MKCCSKCKKQKLIETPTGHTHCTMDCIEYKTEKEFNANARKEFERSNEADLFLIGNKKRRKNKYDKSIKGSVK